MHIPMYSRRELIVHKTLRRQSRRLGRHLNVLCMPNSNHVSTRIKTLCSKIASNKKLYHIETNQLTYTLDRWTSLPCHKSLMKGVLEQKNHKNNPTPGHTTEIDCTLDVHKTSTLLRTSSERLMYPQSKLCIDWNKKKSVRNFLSARNCYKRAN